MFCAEPELPIIDVSALQSELEDGHPDIQILCDQIRDACQQWGAFRVVNHGVEEELFQTMDSACRDLFNLPSEAKQRAVSPHAFEGYSTPTEFSLAESMSFPAIRTSPSLQQYAQLLWPQGNPEFCETLGRYSSKLADLANSIIKLILQGLGLHKHIQSHFEKCENKLALNYFSTCEKSSDDLSFKAHKDFGVMAILYNDQVGGLQVRSKNGDWFSVNPIASSFLVIIGDALKIWSNDRCWSAEHRVVNGGRKLPRLSVVHFLNFPPEKEVSALEDLVDDDHPRRYKSFIFKEYKEAIARGAPINIFL